MNTSMIAALAVAPTVAAFALASSKPAVAGCHLVDCVENVYITRSQIADRSCELLWILRNSIYDDAGYCFQSARAMKWFANEGCRFTDEAEVPLNDYQRSNVEVLKEAEAARGC